MKGLCNVILHVNHQTGCLCSLNEHGEFVIARLVSGDGIATGDLIIDNHMTIGPVSVFNATQDIWLTVDVHCRTRSEGYARHLLTTWSTAH